MHEAAEPADKPGSVVDSHSSRRHVTVPLKQPTRIQRGPRQWIPIWSCSRWGLPCRSVARLAVRSYRTISPLPAPRKERRRYLSVALSVGLRRPGVTWHLALWSPDFPRHPQGVTRLSGRLRQRALSHVACRRACPLPQSAACDNCAHVTGTIMASCCCVPADECRFQITLNALPGMALASWT